MGAGLKLKLGGDNEVSVTVQDVAELFWAMGSDEQAEFFRHLRDVAGSDHLLQMQGLAVRDEVRRRGDTKARDAILDFFVWHFSLWETMQERGAA